MNTNQIANKKLSKLAPLLLNILCYIFCFVEDYDVANYADDMNLHRTKENHELVFEISRESPKIHFK